MGRQARARRKGQKGNVAKAASSVGSKAKPRTPAKPDTAAAAQQQQQQQKTKKTTKKRAGARQHVVANSRLIHGFRILELFDDSGWANFPRFIFVKRHFSHDADNADRTVFVTGLPIDVPVRALEATLQRAFARAFGPVQHARVTMLKDSDGHTTVRCGHVVFEEEDGVEAALSEAEFGIRDNAATAGAAPNQLGGLQAYLEEAREARPPVAALQAANHAAMAKVEADEAEARAAKDRGKGVVDADGFTLVTGKRKISQAAAQLAAEKRARRDQKKRDGMANFYAFQRRETRRDQLAALRSKFEEDKQRVQRMKQARRFKPH